VQGRLAGGWVGHWQLQHRASAERATQVGLRLPTVRRHCCPRAPAGPAEAGSAWRWVLRRALGAQEGTSMLVVPSCSQHDMSCQLVTRLATEGRPTNAGMVSSLSYPSDLKTA
jgi:hypothetical protein